MLTSTNGVDPGTGRSARDAGILGIFFLCLYILTRSQTLSPADDAITLVHRIAIGHWFHPHHLLYNWTAGKWLLLARALGLPGDTAALVEAMNACFGAVTLGIFHVLLRTRAGLKRTGAFLGTAVLGFSFGFWFFSTVVEVYVPALCFLTLAFTLLTRREMSRGRYAWVGGVHGMAVLFHQVHVLFGLVVAMRFVLECLERRPGMVRKAVAYATSAILCVGIPYVWAGASLPSVDTIDTYWKWLTDYAHVDQYWHPVSLGTLLKAVIGFGTCILGGHFFFAIPGVPDRLDRFLGANWLTDDAFVVRHLTGGEAWALLGCSLLLLTLILTGLFRRNDPHTRPQREPLSPLIPCLGIWLATYAVFFFFWEPMNNEFWIPQTLVFWALFASRCLRRPPLLPLSLLRGGPLLATLAGLLLLVNFQGSTRWLMDPEGDYYAVKARALSERASDRDLLVIMHPWMDRDYLQGRTRAPILAVVTAFETNKDQEAGLLTLRKAISDTLSRGDRVWIAGDAVHPAPVIRRLYGPPLSRFTERLWEGYRGQWEVIPTEAVPVYVLGRGGGS